MDSTLVCILAKNKQCVFNRRNTMNLEDFNINTELNDLKYQLIEEGMENYRLTQEVIRLEKENTKTKWFVMITMFSLGLWWGHILFS